MALLDLRLREDKSARRRLVDGVFPLSPQEIARTRHADLLREATQERLAVKIREGASDRPLSVRTEALRWNAVLRGIIARGSTARTA